MAIPLDYLFLRVVRHFLPEFAVRFLLCRSLIIKPGLETKNSASAIQNYLDILSAQNISLELWPREVSPGAGCKEAPIDFCPYTCFDAGGAGFVQIRVHWPECEQGLMEAAVDQQIVISRNSAPEGWRTRTNAT